MTDTMTPSRPPRAHVSLRLRAAALAGMLAFASFAAAGPASAISAEVERGLAECMVAEGVDGLLHVKSGASASLKAEVASINKRRMAAYGDIAARTGASVIATGKVTGEKQIAGLASGRCYKAGDGSWKVKR